MTADVTPESDSAPWQPGRSDPNSRSVRGLPSDPALWSATEQAQYIAVKHVGAGEVLAACLRRFERFNGALNAIIYTQIDQAVESAARLDDDMDGASERHALSGVPATVKEAIDWVGTPSTWGLPSMADYRPARNAAVVDLLIDQGALLFGKTNVPAMLGDWQSYNDLYGTTNNPWDLTRTPGGSSGGSAAALASGMSAIEIGSDIGGSIRFPAHYTGLFGHKPTFGLVPTRGHSFPGQDGAVDVNVVGPLARSADDLQLVMDVLAPGAALSTRAGRRRKAVSASLADWKVGVVLDSPVTSQDSAMTAVLRSAVDALCNLGLDAHDDAQPAMSHQEALEVSTMLVRAATSIHDPAAETFATDLSRYNAGDRDYGACAAKATTMTHREWMDLNNTRGRHQQLWADFFDQYDVLLCPVAASPAPVHDHQPFANQEIMVDGRPVSVTHQWFWAGWPGAMHLPSTIAPVGRTPEGLPVGIQIIAPMHGDQLSIMFAQLIEWHLGGFVWPPGYETP